MRKDPKLSLSPRPSIAITLNIFTALKGLSSGLLLGFWIFLQSTGQQTDTAFDPKAWNDMHKGLSITKSSWVFFYADYCYPCSFQADWLAKQPQLFSKLDDSYQVYRINALSTETGGKALAQKYGIETLPAVLITDHEGKTLHLWEGLAAPLQVQEILVASRIDQFSQAPLAPQRSYGLVIKRGLPYAEAKRLAALHEKAWNQGVWMVPDRRGSYQLILGTFASKTEARVVQKYIELWENIKGRIVSIPVVFNPSLGSEE